MLHFISQWGIQNLTEDNLKEILTFANAAASLITTRKGALTVMPDLAEIEALRQTREG
jgi:fructokinase